MKIWCVLAALAFALLGTVRGDDSDSATSAATSAPAAADVQELVLLAPASPIVVRLHIQLQGQPYQSTWGD